MSHRKTKLVFASIVGAGAVIATSAFGVTAANADPVTPSTDIYTAVGSDTIQSLYNSYESDHIASWDATPVGTATTPTLITPVNKLAGTGLTIGRPNGSGDGRKALSAAWNPAKSTWVQNVGGTNTTYTETVHSIDIARSSGKPSDLSADHLTSVPLARDAVSVATNGFTANFTTGELEAIFGLPNDPVNSPVASTGVYTQHAGSVTVGDIQRVQTTTADPFLVTGFNALGNPIRQELHVEVPQPSSGTRQFFQNALGGTNTTAKATWATENHEENHANELATVGSIIPFSAAQYIAQVNGFAPNTGVLATGIHLDPIGVLPYNGTLPTSVPTTPTITITPNPAFFGSGGTVPTSGIGHFNRDVYSVVPSTVIEGAFVPGSVDPTYDADIKTLVTVTLPTTEATKVTNGGFEQITYSATPSTWIQSNWEN